MAQDGEIEAGLADGLLGREVDQPAVLHELRFGPQETRVDHMLHAGGLGRLERIQVLPQPYVVRIVGRNEQRLRDTLQRAAHQVGLAEVRWSHGDALTGKLADER